MKPKSDIVTIFEDLDPTEEDGIKKKKKKMILRKKKKSITPLFEDVETSRDWRGPRRTY